MGEGVLPGFRCLGSSLGWDGEGGASGYLRCDVACRVFLSHLSLGIWSVCVVYLPSKYHSPGSMIFFVCVDSGFRFVEMDLFWVETVGLRILSWGRVECLGCFVDSRLQVCNSSKRCVGVFFLVHPQDGMERGCIRLFVM